MCQDPNFILKKLLCQFFYTVGTLFFTKTVFKAEENVGSIMLELTLSNPSSNNITVQIESIDKSATG